MTYIHSQLGVPCLTTSEFWKSLADSEGKEVSDVIEDYYSDLADDEDRAAKELAQNKPEIMKMLLEYYNPEYGDVDFIPTEILQVISSTVRYSPSKSTTTVKTVINCSDGETRIVEYSETSWSGSYLEPPDFESNCKVISTLSQYDLQANYCC